MSSRRLANPRATVAPFALLALATTQCGPTQGKQPPSPSSVADQPAGPPRSTWKPAPSPLMTQWAAQVDPSKPLPEYPRPQMVRNAWQNLNGLWELAIITDPSAPIPFGKPFAQQVLVPFPIESALSGVGKHVDRVLYRRTFRAAAGAGDGRLLLHFGAVDWRAEIYVNGRKLAEHTGGYDAFTVDITDAIAGEGDQELIVAVYDPTDGFGQPRGKQVRDPSNFAFFYTPVTGIWQTVWLEPVPRASVATLRMTPDVNGAALRLQVSGRGTEGAHVVEAIAFAEGKEVGRVQGALGAELRVPVPNPRLWGPRDPFLYDLRVVLRAGTQVVDQVDSYFGMRTVALGKDAHGFQRILLNGEPWFAVGPLDQGYWPDGLYTAPTDEALRWDLEETRRLGYGFTRKHIKVEPARWYYHADRLGIPVWQDMPCGNNDTLEARTHFERELVAMLDDLHNHPSVIVWVPFNESWGQWSVEETRRIAKLIHDRDPSRLVNDASGWRHTGAGHIQDAHRYQGPQALPPSKTHATVVGEYGGLGYLIAGHAWRPGDDNWGYGGAFKDQSSLNDRYDVLMKRMWRLRDTHAMSAGVYTQLTDVEKEINGMYTYDRAVLKFDAARVAAVNSGIAPYILPEEADIIDPVEVSIVQGTATEIRYTLDGSEPTAAAPLYIKSFTVRGDTTVRARGFLDGKPTAAPETRVDYRKVTGREPVVGVRVVPGVDYAYYSDDTAETPLRLTWPVFHRLRRLEAEPNDPQPTKRGTLPSFDLTPRTKDEMFGFSYTGYLRVPQDGVYTITTLVNDGVCLWIGDRQLMCNMHVAPGVQEDHARIALKAGLHPFTLGYFNAYDAAMLEVYIAGPKLSRRRLPASMLFRAATAPAPR